MAIDQPVYSSLILNFIVNIVFIVERDTLEGGPLIMVGMVKACWKEGGTNVPFFFLSCACGRGKGTGLVFVVRLNQHPGTSCV